MPSAARLTDIWTGQCCCHKDPTCIPMTGKIIGASTNVISTAKGQARLIDITIGECGHPGRIVSGSSVCLANARQKAVLTSLVVGCNIGRVVSGNTTHEIGFGGGTFYPLSITPFQDRVVVHTEGDFGNEDDDPNTDDGMNMYPPLQPGQKATPAQIARSAELDNSPTTTVGSDSTAAPDISTPPTSCMDVSNAPLDDFQLSPNFVLGDVSSQTAISKKRVVAQAGYTVQDLVCNLQAWAEHIGEAISAKYGRDEILITSGFRNGSGKSQHERGEATDIQFPNMTWEQIYDVAAWIKDNLPFDQLILEYGGTNPWIHSSFSRSGNRPSLASNKFGTRIAPGNYVWTELRNMA